MSELNMSIPKPHRPFRPSQAGFIAKLSGRTWSGGTDCNRAADVNQGRFECSRDLRSIRCRRLLLFQCRDNEVTAGELKSRGYYRASNVSL